MAKKKFHHFSDETTIHAVKDFYYGNALGKTFWGTLAILAVAGLVLQLEGVILQFVEEETGSTMTEYSPSTLPAFSICPDKWVNQTLAEQHGIGSREVSIIGGFMSYAGISQLFAINTGGLFVERVVQAMSYKSDPGTNYSEVMDLWKKGGNTIEGIVDAVGLKNIETVWLTLYPMDANFTSTRTITSSGVCYKYEADIAINKILSTQAGIKFSFNIPDGIGPDVYEDEPYYRIIMGPTDEIDVVSSSVKTFRYNNHYIVLYSMMKVIRVSTRKWPCRDWTPGDEAYCANKHGNEVAPGEGGCQNALPRSNFYPPTETDNPCNTFIDVAGSSTVKFAKLKYTNGEWNKLCPRPCTFTTYQYTYQLEKENFGGTMLEFRKAEGMSGMLIKEYLIMGVSGMLSNIGGTLGLWIGASVMSAVQVIYVFLLEGCMAKKQVAEEQKK